MKEPRKKASVALSPRMEAELRHKDKMRKAMALVAEDQVWRHESGTEYTVILISNKDATKSGYEVTVNYYGPDGKYWAQSLERFVEDKVFLNKKVSALTPAEEELGSWMSAAIDCSESCPEFKAAAQAWLNELPIPKEGN